MPAPSAADAGQAGRASPGDGDDASTMSEDEIFRRLFGRERPPVAAGRYVVVIDGINSGEAQVDPGGGWIDAGFLKAVVMPMLLAEPAGRLRPLLTRERVAFGDLEALGFALRFDATQLVLVLDMPLEMRQARILRLRGWRQPTNVEFASQAGISASASVRGGVDLVEQSNDERTGFSGFAANIDLVANVHGVVAQARLRYDEHAGRAFSRSDIRLTYDDIDALIRYEVGDLTVSHRPFQAAPRIAGLAAYREYRIDPYLNPRPTGEKGFELESAARVEVLVNGASVRTFNLNAGRYSLRDFPLISSATNDVQLKITTASGEQQVIAFPAFLDIDLLDAGRLEFAVNAGVPYRDRDGMRVYDDGNYNLMGFARYGLSQTLTLGGSIEGDKDFTLLGAEATWASPIGSIHVDVAADARRPGPDSSRLALQYSWRDADYRRGSALDAQIVLTGKDYRTLNNIFGGSLSAVFAQARYGRYLGDDLRLQLGGSYERVRSSDFGRGDGDRWTAGAAVNKQFGFVSVGASLDYQRDSERSEVVGRLSLFVPLGRGTATSSYETRGNTLRAEYTRSATTGVGSFGFNVGAERRDGADRQFARANYVGNRFDAAVEQNRTASGGRSDIRTSVAFGTALVMADGVFALSRPVTNSFAIVRNASEIHTPLAIEPRAGLGGLDRRYSAFSGTLGPGVVPDLPAYYERPIQVDAPDAPPGSGLGGDVFYLKPGYRSGYALEVGAGQGSVSALGVLVARDGTPLAYISGEARPVGKPGAPAITLFTNSAGRFFLEGLEPGESYEAVVTADGQAVRVILEVPKDARGIWRLETPLRLEVEAPHAEK